MSVIYVLLAISISVAVVFFTVFIISVRNGQYDDSYTPSVRMLFEDELVKPLSSKTGEEQSEYSGETPKSTTVQNEKIQLNELNQ